MGEPELYLYQNQRKRRLLRQGKGRKRTRRVLSDNSNSDGEKTDSKESDATSINDLESDKEETNPLNENTNDLDEIPTTIASPEKIMRERKDDDSINPANVDEEVNDESQNKMDVEISSKQQNNQHMICASQDYDFELEGEDDDTSSMESLTAIKKQKEKKKMQNKSKKQKSRMNKNNEKPSNSKSSNKWTPEEDALLEKLYPLYQKDDGWEYILSKQDLFEKHNRSMEAIKRRVKFLKLNENTLPNRLSTMGLAEKRGNHDFLEDSDDNEDKNAQEEVKKHQNKKDSILESQMNSVGLDNDTLTSQTVNQKETVEKTGNESIRKNHNDTNENGKSRKRLKKKITNTTTDSDEEDELFIN